MMLLIAMVSVAALEGPALLVATDRLNGLEQALAVDARSLETFEQGHVPGAAHLDVNTLSETRDGVAGLLRPLRDVRQVLRRAGVAMDRHVVVYSGMDAPADFKTAARLFWILEYAGYPRVSILDGGFAKWKRENRPVEQGKTTIRPAPVPKLQPRADRLATLDQVSEAIRDGSAVLADLRPAAYYRGEKKADVVKRAGHIPGACSLPDEAFLDPVACTVKPPDALDEALAEQGVGKDESVIAYCNTGRSASVGYFILRLAGRDRAAVYDGSMAEWGARDKREVAAEHAEEN